MPEPPASARWRSQLRARLAPLALAPEREAEIVEELVQMLGDAEDDASTGRGDFPALNDLAWQELIDEIDRGERRPPPTRTTAQSRRGSMTGLRHDFVYALRGLRKKPGLAAVAVLTLALGIGINAAVFSLVDHVWLRPLAVERGDELVRIYGREPKDFVAHGPMAYPDFEDLSAQAEGLVGTAAFAMTFVALEGASGDVDLTVAEMVTGGYFPLLGVKPAFGRLLGPDDDERAHSSAAMVLSYRAWQRRFGGDPQIIGSESIINGRPLTIVGVAPEDFRGLSRGIEPDVWFPVGTGIELGASATTNVNSNNPGIDDRRDDRRHRWLWMIGRRAQGTSFDQAATEIATIGERLASGYPDSNERRELISVPSPQVKILPGGIDNGLVAASSVLMALVGLVLLIACANLANLFLAKALGRRKEIATRLSLGASHGRIVRQMLVESGLLAILGAAASLLVVAVSNQTLSRFRVPSVIPISITPVLDLRVVAFALAMGIATALLFGMTPALEAWRTDLNAALHDGGRGGSRRRRRLQGALVVAQVSLSMLLLVFAGLSVRSIYNATRMDPGFDPEGTVAATLMPALQGYDEERLTVFFKRLREELVAYPGIEAVSMPSHLPLTFWSNTWSVTPAGTELPPREDWPEVDTAAVDASYFETMAIPLIAGRTFEPADTTDQRRVMVVNQAFAERFWPDGEALGQLVQAGREGSQPYEVVGIVRNGRYRTLGEAPLPHLYYPISDDWDTRAVVVRFGRRHTPSTAAVARVIHGIDPHLAISSLGSLAEVTGASLALPRLSALLFGIFGLLGLLLAALGLYGILSYTVSQRHHEIGIRMAIGADQKDILRLVVGDGLRLTLIGAVLGIGAALASARVLSAILYGVSPTDAGTLIAVVALLAAVATVASLLPARRATEVEPVRALRCE